MDKKKPTRKLATGNQAASSKPTLLPPAAPAVGPVSAACSGHRTEPTLAQEATGKAILKAPGVSVEAMDADEFFNRWGRAARVKWYCSKLCAYQEQLFESSRRNNVPAQLIAACVLNEMADIKVTDVWQEKLGAIEGSLGPAQMQVRTAVRFGHVDAPRDVLERNAEANSMEQAPIPGDVYMPPPPKGIVLRSYVSKRLKIMQVGIEGAARELARLLTLMAENKTKSWQQQHAFNAPAPRMAPHPEVYFQKNSIRGLDDHQRFEQLCEAVIAAYNSPDIVVAMNPGKSILATGTSSSGPYVDARNHGANGATIGEELFLEGLFAPRR